MGQGFDSKYHGLYLHWEAAAVPARWFGMVYDRSPMKDVRLAKVPRVDRNGVGCAWPKIVLQISNAIRLGTHLQLGCSGTNLQSHVIQSALANKWSGPF